MIKPLLRTWREGAERKNPKDGVVRLCSCVIPRFVREGTARHPSVGRSLRTPLTSPLWGIGNSRGNPLCGACRTPALHRRNLTHLPVAVPSWKDLGKTAYEWLLLFFVTSSAVSLAPVAFIPLPFRLEWAIKAKAPRGIIPSEHFVGSLASRQGNGQSLCCIFMVM